MPPVLYDVHRLSEAEIPEFFPEPRDTGDEGDCKGRDGAIPPDNPAVVNHGLTHLVIYADIKIQQCVISISISVVASGYGNL